MNTRSAHCCSFQFYRFKDGNRRLKPSGPYALFICYNVYFLIQFKIDSDLCSWDRTRDFMVFVALFVVQWAMRLFAKYSGRWGNDIKCVEKCILDKIVLWVVQNITVFHKMPTSLFFFSNNNSLIFFNKITIILFSSSLSLFLLFSILLLLKKKNKRKSKKCDVSYECIFVQSCLALRPLSPVHWTSCIDHSALNIVRCVLCRVHCTLHVDHRF